MNLQTSHTEDVKTSAGEPVQDSAGSASPSDEDLAAASAAWLALLVVHVMKLGFSRSEAITLAGGFPKP